MPGISWNISPTPTDHPCILCGNRQQNRIILNASHWHSDYGRIEVAVCNKCHSAYTLDASEKIVPYPSAETALRDPDFIFLIYHYLELVSGLDWKLPLLERLAFDHFNSVLEIGCNVGITLDYCRTAWGVEVLGLEPSAYGIKGGQLLQLPIINAYTYEAKELRGRRFSFIYATEVLEHVPDPLAFLEEMRGFLEPGGILLITTPSSSALHKDTLPGELYAVLSPGAHYFLLSQKQLRRLAQQAGFKHVEIELVYQTNVAYLSDRPVRFEAVPAVDSRLAAYHAAKIGEAAILEDRVDLGHLLNYYIAAIKAAIPIDEERLSNEIDKALHSQFNLSLDNPLDLAQRITRVQSIFDLGRTLPYSLPVYLYHRAEYLNTAGKTTDHCYELAALIAAKGLQIDFKNLVIYNLVLWHSLQRIETISTRPHDADHTTLELRSMIRTIKAEVPELNEKPLTPLSRIKRKLRTLRNRWLPK